MIIFFQEIVADKNCCGGVIEDPVRTMPELPKIALHFPFLYEFQKQCYIDEQKSNLKIWVTYLRKDTMVKTCNIGFFATQSMSDIPNKMLNVKMTSLRIFYRPSRNGYFCII